jgi:hypothetical protein
MSKYTKILRVGTKLVVWTDRQTDRQTDGHESDYSVLPLCAKYGKPHRKKRWLKGGEGGDYMWKNDGMKERFIKAATEPII